MKSSRKEKLPGSRTVILNNTEYFETAYIFEVLSTQHLRTLH
jgi:hypothetical protein